MSHAPPPVDPHALLAHHDFVRAIARSLLRDDHDAEDVVQETWIAALERNDRPSRGWLAAVSRNLSIKRLRSDGRRIAREALVARPERLPTDHDVRERERLRQQVVDAVLGLPEPYRTTVLLRFFESRPPRDVARAMAVPVETVRTRTRRAMSLLRERLDPQTDRDRRVLGSALAVWADSVGGHGRPTLTNSATLGGTVMGTKAITAGAVLLVAGVAGWVLWSNGAGDAGGAVTGGATAATSTASGDADGGRRRDTASDGRAPKVDEVPVIPRVAGRVIDASGEPVAGLEVRFVRGTDADLPVGRSITDDDGRFVVELDEARPCRVVLCSRTTPAIDIPADVVREVRPPADDVDFVVRRHPTATLVIAAVDAASGTRVDPFSCTFGGRVVETHRNAETAVTEATVRLAGPRDDVEFLVSTATASANENVSVEAGARIDVRCELRQDGVVRGTVRDDAGKVVANALVFFGQEDVARGDEPFKPFQVKRIRDGVRTDDAGRFELAGRGRWITIWHDTAGPVTVPRGDALDVVLPARGSIDGVLFDDAGAPLATTKVLMDRVHATTTDAAGRFRFADVEPGVRGLTVDGRPNARFAVRVAPGEATAAELRAGVPEVRLTWPGRDELGRFVVLVPQDPVGSLAFGGPTGNEVTLPGVLPGRYTVLGQGGAVGRTEVTDGRATVVVGTGVIRVRAPEGRRLWVVPAGAGYLAQLMAGRLAGSGVPAGGVQEFSGLPPGRYEVGVERDGLRQVVEIDATTVTVEVE